MGSRPPKRAEEPQYGGDQTRPEATTPVAPLANPLDKGYLCGKCCPALLEPMTNRRGYPMYQRTVTRSIWDDNRLKKQYWRYKGEVGYDMTKEPPAPIMSASEETRPSTFPLSALQSINRAAQAAAEAAADAAGDPLTRQDLEAAGGKSLRIPDVIVLRCPSELLGELKAGTADIRHFIPVQQNIERIVEVKFDGDSLDELQAKAYATIAGEGEFNLLQPEHPDPELGCRCRTRRRQPKQVPVSVPSRAPARATARRLALVRPQPVTYPQGMRPLGETLSATPTSHVSGWPVVLAGALVVLAVAAAPETGGASLVLLAAP
ncbi:hypothetical protein P3T42_005926 [Paraburkholderia sp. GAS38]|uniref:VRR-NUC domain-containing protein n=1 Tax=Paraburkholderia sp. GAS38 TaxID=3035133 RepID=UPI003D1C9F07